MTPESDDLYRSSRWWDNVLYVGVAATAWVVVFDLNRLLFQAGQVNSHIDWVFLPAAIRVLSVLVLGWPAVIGLFIGASMTGSFQTWGEYEDDLVIIVLSSIGPWISVKFCTNWLNLPHDLKGLKPRQLSLFALSGAFLNSVPQNIYFYISGETRTLFSGLIPMFTGDLVGTFIMLWVTSVALRFVLRTQT